MLAAGLSETPLFLGERRWSEGQALGPVASLRRASPALGERQFAHGWRCVPRIWTESISQLHETPPNQLYLHTYLLV